MPITRREWAALLGVGSAALAAGQQIHPKEEVRRRSGGASPDANHRGLTTPEEIWNDLMEGNRRFVAGQPRQRNLIGVRQALVKEQHPQVIVLGCADSRVCPELLFDKNLGELFVVRTAGNVADPVAVGSLEYAAEHLHSRMLVVLGHESCGAVAATIAGGKMPTPGLEAIARHIAPAVERARSEAGGEALANLAAIMNVHQSAIDLLKNSPILHKEVAAGKLTLVKAYYRLSNGQVSRL
jgi:carbonic anhydrase